MSDPTFTVKKMTREEFLSRVDIGTRFRTELEKDSEGQIAKDDENRDLSIPNLVNSINEVGLIHSIAVASREAVETSESLFNTYTDPNKQELLIAGGRRYAAIAHSACTVSHVPVKIYEAGLTERLFRRIELVENLHRKQLNWNERLALTKAVHELGVEERGEWTQVNKEGHAQKDTAKELGISTAQVSRNLATAEILEKRPELAAFKSEHELIKHLKKEARDRKLKEKQAAVEEKRSMTSEDEQKKKLIRAYSVIPEKPGVPLLEQGFFEWVKTIENESVHAVECDPPYGIGLNKVKKKADDRTSLLDYNEVKDSDYPDFITKILTESQRIMRPNSWLFLWFATKWWSVISREVLYAGKPEKMDIRTWRKDPRRLRCNFMPIVWSRGSSGQNMQPNYNLSHVYDMCFYIFKGRPGIVAPRGDEFVVRPVTAKKKIHDTERPIQLYEEIFKAFLAPGSSICVPFLGSGKAILAANNVGMTAFGCDMSENYKARFVNMVVEGRVGKFSDR